MLVSSSPAGTPEIVREGGADLILRLIEASAGDSAAGIAALEQAAAAELALPVVFGPPAIYKPSYEILGELYLAQGQKAQAKAAFEKALELAPGRRLSLEGLARAGSS